MAKVKVDFTDVSDSMGAVAPGKYIARVKAITKEEGAKAPYLKWELQILSGSAKGLSINHITSLSANALFNLRDTLLAIGVKVPKSAVAIDTDKFIGKQLGIEVVLRKVDDKEYPNIKKVYSMAEASAKKEVAPAVEEDVDFPDPISDDEVCLDLD